MRRITAMTVIVLLLVLMLSACGTSGNGSEKEANNTFNTANEISVDSVVKGKISEKDDEDWFMFTLTAVTEISVDMSFGRWVSDDTYWTIVLYEADGVNVLDYYKVAGNKDVSFDFGVLDKGVYLVKMSASKGGGHISYDLSIVKKHECTGTYIMVQEATCTQEGAEEKRCTICGTLYDMRLIPKKSHACDNWEVDVQPTCKNEGSRHGFCNDCNVSVTETMPKTDHTFGKWETVSGNVIIPPIVKEKSCTQCGITETIEDWGYVWVTVLAGIAAIGLCFGVVAYLKAYRNP